MFHRFQKGIHIFNSFVLLLLAGLFFQLAVNEFYIARVTARILEGVSELSEALTTSILEAVRRILFLQKLMLTAYSTFCLLLVVSKFREVKFPVFGSTLVFLAAPIAITFTWMNQDHLLMTLSIAATWTGSLLIGVRLVMQGLKKKFE